MLDSGTRKQCGKRTVKSVPGWKGMPRKTITRVGWKFTVARNIAGAGNSMTKTLEKVVVGSAGRMDSSCVR